jgi:hypothetical protein
MSIDSVVGFVGVLAAAGWLLWALNRLSAAWTAAQSRIKDLDQKRIDMARSLMKLGEELIRLKQDDAESSQKLAALRAQCTARQKEVAEFVPPPPQEIMVSSEYPPARDDKAWVVSLVRSTAGTGSARQYLIWAADHGGALSRGRHVLADEPGYEISGAQRYS